MFIIKRCISVCFVIVAAVFAAAPSLAQERASKEFHNLQAATGGDWVIYAWTDAKAYRPGEPIKLSMRFVTESTDKLDVASATVIATSADEKKIVKRDLDLKPQRKLTEPVQLCVWSTDNLIPHDDDKDRSALYGKGDYLLQVVVKLKTGEVAIVDKIRVNVGGRR